MKEVTKEEFETFVKRFSYYYYGEDNLMFLRDNKRGISIAMIEFGYNQSTGELIPAMKYYINDSL